MLCRKPNNLNLRQDNTKHTFLSLPTNFTLNCGKRLNQIKLLKDTEINDFGYETKHSIIHFFIQSGIYHLQIQLLIKICLLLWVIFFITPSIQDAQVLTQTNCCNKYICKYIGKVDEQNYVIVSSSAHKMGL